MRAYENTPLLLLSALGPGADQLAAKVATEMPGVDLAVILPWPEGVCDELRHRGGDVSEFATLLARAEHAICLPLPDGIIESDLAGSPDLQQQCFEAVGRYLTRHCQALIAIWDGVESDESQTWQVIRWHREGTSAPFALGASHLDEPETGPVWHFPVRRGATTAPMEKTDVIDEPSKDLLRAFGEIAKNFDRFNRHTTKHGSRLAAGMTISKGYLFPESEQTALSPPLRFLLDRFAQADQLAIWWQWASLRVLITILGLIFLTVTLFECYAHLAPGQVALLVGYPVLFGAGWLLVWQERRWRIYNRYLDFRALAEAMRVHLFWKLAGLRENAADYYLRSCRSQLDWIRAALRVCSVQSGEHDFRCSYLPDHLPDPGTLDQIRVRWMTTQQEFFAKNEKRDHDNAHLCHRWAQGFLSISLAATVIQSVRLLWVHWHHDHHIGYDGTTHVFIMIIAMGGVLAGLCHEYLEKRLFEKQSRSYGWMASLYQTALNRFDTLKVTGDTEGIQALLRELGREALAENADWVIYHREREPEMKGH
ncbi:MAG: hypothetical protein IT576_20470 [Verrucomicrobiales bacterium]|nr:hypothetical protein [Verrucomicrobiales bacterium]